MSARLSVLQQAGPGARRRRRGRWRLLLGWALLVLVLGGVALLVFMAGTSGPPQVKPRRSSAHRASSPAQTHLAPRPNYGVQLVPAAQRPRVSFKLSLLSGMLFDVRTGRVLWERDPDQQLPIASLTKMMTALVVVAHTRPGSRVRITRQAINFSGSGVGNLPFGKRVPLLPLLYGLLLPSGNDAAIALSQHVAGTRPQFIAMMNDEARTMGLHCTHFNTVSGIVDQGNYSCATDLAIIAHAVLEQPQLSKIVASKSAVLPFPVKGGKLFLYNNNPLLRLGYPGTDGVKTGFTTAAGHCLVAAAKRGGTWLAVVLLNSADTSDQAQALLNAGFAAMGR